MARHSATVDPGLDFESVEPRLRHALIALYGPARGRAATVLSLHDLLARRVRPPHEGEPLLHVLFSHAQRHSSLLRTPPLFDRPPDALPWLEPEVAAALSFLSRDERVAAVLASGAGWTPEEIADLLAVSTEWASQLSERGIDRLEQALASADDRDGDEDDGDDGRRLAASTLQQRMSTLLDEIVAPVSLVEATAEPARTPPSRLSVSSFPRLIVLALVAVVVLVVALVVGLEATRSNTVTSFETSGAEPAPGPLSGSVVVLPNLPGTGGGRSANLPAVAEIDAATGARLHAPRALGLAAASPPITTGRWVVDVLFHSVSSYPDAGEVVAFHTDSHRMTDLGQATSAYPGLKPGTVWLLLRYATMSGKGSRSCTIRLVTTTGRFVIPPTPVPCPWQILHAVRGGLVVLARTGLTEVWDPYSGLTEPLAGVQAPVVEAEGSTIVAPQWPRFCSTHCVLLVADPITAAVTRVVVQPPTGISLTTSAAVSPNGAFIAFTGVPIGVATTMENSPVVGPDCCDSGDRAIRGRLVVIRVPTGSVDAVTPTTIALPTSTSTATVPPATTTVALSRPAAFLQPSLVEWSANGSYVFLTRSTSGVLAVPVWSVAAPEAVIPIDTPPGRPPDPGDRFLIVER